MRFHNRTDYARAVHLASVLTIRMCKAIYIYTSAFVKSKRKTKHLKLKESEWGRRQTLRRRTRGKPGWTWVHCQAWRDPRWLTGHPQKCTVRRAGSKSSGPSPRFAGPSRAPQVWRAVCIPSSDAAAPSPAARCRHPAGPAGRSPRDVRCTCRDMP